MPKFFTSKFINVIFVILLPILFVLKFYNNKENDKNILLLSKYSDLIKKYCSILSIEPRKYASIIYGELKTNYDDFDRFDEIRARLGFDPSVGFAQIKISTANWIEANFTDNLIIFRSSNSDELINKMITDSTNILYSAFYIKLINSKLKKKFYRKPSILLLASYYARGIDYDRENDLDSLYHNRVGITAEEFYNSDKLF